MQYGLRRTLTLLVLALTLAGCTLPGTPTPEATSAPAATATPLGTQGNPIVLAARPGSTREATDAAQRIAGQLSAFTGLVIVLSPTSSETQLVDSIGAGEVHIAMLTPFAYLLAHDKGFADAALAGVVDGKSKLGAEFLVNAQWAGVSGMKIYFDPASNVNLVDAPAALTQFRDRKPCWTDASSPGGYVVPLGLLSTLGVATKPGAFLQGDVTVVKTLYQDTRGGLCDFGVTYTGSRAAVAADLPDVNDKVSVVWQTEAIVPLDGFVFATELPADARTRLASAFLAIAASAQGAADLKTGYGVDGLQLSDDLFYNDLRPYVEWSGLDLTGLVH